MEKESTTTTTEAESALDDSCKVIDFQEFVARKKLEASGFEVRGEGNRPRLIIRFHKDF